MLAACAVRFRHDPFHQVGIPFGIEHDHHITPVDVLGNQDFGQPGLADTGSAQHQGIAWTAVQRHGHVGFFHSDSM